MKTLVAIELWKKSELRVFNELNQISRQDIFYYTTFSAAASWLREYHRLLFLLSVVLGYVPDVDEVGELNNFDNFCMLDGFLTRPTLG